MDSPQSGLSARTIAELALVISKVARTHLDSSSKPSVASLKLFWQSSRSLEKRWALALDDWTVARARDLNGLEQLAMRVLTSEMLARIWGTVLACYDQVDQNDDLIHVAQSAVGCFARTRNALLSRLVTVPEQDEIHAHKIDRLRRRCERWTDLLLGPLAVKSGRFEFAFVPERALDFGEELLSNDSATCPNPAEHLVLAAMQLTFGPHLSSNSGNDDAELVTLVQSVITHLPATAFQRNGSLRSLLQQRLMPVDVRSDRHPQNGIFGALKDVLVPSRPNPFFKPEHE